MHTASYISKYPILFSKLGVENYCASFSFTVLQLLASRLSCTKDSSPPILKLSDQIPLISMGQPLDLKRNSVDLVNQQTQMLQQQIIQQTQKQSFEDLMKVAAGLMTKSDIVPDVEPMQVVSPAIGKQVLAFG